MNSEGENLTMTQDPSVFDDPIPLTQLKGGTNPPTKGSAALKLQQVLNMTTNDSKGHQRNQSHLTCNTSIDTFQVKTIDDIGHQLNDVQNSQAQSSLQKVGSKFQKPKPSMRSKMCTCPSVYKQLEKQRLEHLFGHNPPINYVLCGDMCKNTPPQKQKSII